MGFSKSKSSLLISLKMGDKIGGRKYHGKTVLKTFLASKLIFTAFSRNCVYAVK